MVLRNVVLASKRCMYIGPHMCMSGYVSAYHGVGKLCILLHTVLCHAVICLQFLARQGFNFIKLLRLRGKANYRIEQWLKKRTENTHRQMFKMKYLLSFILVMLATNATSERSFRALRRVKTAFLRTTITQIKSI